MTLNEIFGENVRNRRKELHLSQEELADRADLHRTYISDIENCTRNVSLETVEKIAKALDTSPDTLLKPTFIAQLT